jgi:AbrB family looped-hinge helix DNA binding protein
LSSGPGPTNVSWYGLIAVTSASQVTIPAEARRELGIAPNSQVLAFGELQTGRLILMPPPPADELLEFVTQRAMARRSQPE